MSTTQNKVSAEQFRNLCDHLLRVINADWHSCGHAEEKLQNTQIAHRRYTELQQTAPKRWTAELQALHARTFEHYEHYRTQRALPFIQSALQSFAVQRPRLHVVK